MASRSRPSTPRSNQRNSRQGKRSIHPRIGHRLPGFDFRSKPYQEFSLNLDDQLSCLVAQWRPCGEHDQADCPSRQAASELGV